MKHAGIMSKWTSIRRLRKNMKKMREMQLLLVGRYMKKVYNPMYFKTKPKHRDNMGVDDMLSFETAMKKVYNPPVKREYNDMIDIEVWDMAKT
ncbi:hypothetical protein GOV08_00835 [Candidatus Woesearchaeota archaeon]|nr:hypothetical protein [Candidatus Woesearchaeota archaeon]